MKDNKFLTGFLIVTLLGAGALGFLLFQAKGKHSDARAAYEEKVNELQSLQAGKPYPDEGNYKKVLDLQKAHQQAINDLQKQLSGAEFPVEPISPEKFQDNLREAIKRVRALAAQKGTVIEGDKFSLGFEVYESQPPKPEAAPQLGRMLKAIEKVITDLLNTSPTKLNANIKRVPLPEEGLAVPGAPKPQATPTPKPGVGGKKAVEEAPLVKRYPFDIEFAAHEPKVRTFINKLVTSKEQFLIPASVVIANEQLTGPSKSAGTASVEPPPPAPADPNAAPANPANPANPAAEPAPAPAAAPVEATKFIVGEEKLTVGVRIEVVDFAEPAPEKSEAKPSKPAPAK